MTYSIKYWAVVPAAGVGKRMNADRPKQYLPLLDKTVIEHTLMRLLKADVFSAVAVAISEEDPYWPELDIASNEKVITAAGGKERADSVLSALKAIRTLASDDDWVLVHDAARPGITPALIEKLINAVKTSSTGGILAIPLADTLKQADLDSVIAGNIPHAERTIPREHLWQAQTPQMFGLKQLHDALENAIRLEADVTDEASAIELAGAKPLLIEGALRNFKVTHPADWELMQLLLSSSANQ